MLCCDALKKEQANLRYPYYQPTRPNSNAQASARALELLTALGNGMHVLPCLESCEAQALAASGHPSLQHTVASYEWLAPWTTGITWPLQVLVAFLSFLHC